MLPERGNTSRGNTSKGTFPLDGQELRDRITRRAAELRKQWDMMDSPSVSSLTKMKENAQV